MGKPKSKGKQMTSLKNQIKKITGDNLMKVNLQKRLTTLERTAGK